MAVVVEEEGRKTQASSSLVNRKAQAKEGAGWHHTFPVVRHYPNLGECPGGVCGVSLISQPSSKVWLQ